MNSQPSTVLILGARGRFGLAATRAFAQAGWRVLAQVRPGACGPQIAGVQWLPADPADTAALAAGARGATVVVQALSPVYTHKAWRREIPRLTAAAIGVTRALGNATLMLPASVYNFGESMPARLLEDTAQAPSTVKGRWRQDSERLIRAATEDGGMKAVVIRGGDFFGSGAGSWVDQVMVKSIRQGRFTYPGPMDLRHAWAYLPDMARSFVSVARERARLDAFEMLHFAGYHASGQDWAGALQAIARGQGWLAPDAPLRVSRLPWPLMGLAGLVVPTFAALYEMRYLWRTPHQLVDRRMAELTGEVHCTPFADAVRASLADLGLLEAAGRSAALSAA